jgi:transposase-like protein
VGKYLSEPLHEPDLPVIVIDGTQMAKHLLVIAIGIDTEGRKHVLGVVEGSTESAAVGQALLRQLIERGLPVGRARLVVMDGSKGLRKAVCDAFGNWALIQRCRVHKLNNVLDHLPRHIRPWFAAKLRKAWDSGAAKQAEARLLSVARELDMAHPGAAASLREGLEETLTLNRLGLDPTKALLKTLSRTQRFPPAELFRRLTRDCAQASGHLY